MKNIILKYGAYAAGIIVILFSFSWLFLEGTSYSIQEIFGYAVILISVSFVYFGMKDYRDKVNDNKLTFVEGLKLGVMIVAIPSVVFGLYNVFYVEILNPEFIDEYYTHYAEKMKLSMTPEEFKIEFAKMEADQEMFRNPIFQFLLMGLTVFFVGIIVTVISTLILKKS